jgi:hypothetical protein
VERTPVQSSNIASIGYDTETLTLEVEFLSGGIYQYFGVPQDVYDSFISASSKGTFFHHNIKNAGYPHSKIG